MLTSLFALLLSVSVQVHHWQVPVVLDKDVAVAEVTLPDGAAPVWKIKASGLPCKALRSAYVKDKLLYVNVY